MARRFAARIGVVREAAGIVAYRAGHYSEALSDLRAARRMTGSDSYLPVMADCERGLGRPERAIDLVRSPEAERLDRDGRIEMTIVESGARRDLGQFDAAVITLQRLPELRDPQPKPWSARLAFAYADALADAGHQEAAADWFERAMTFDEDGETDAAERYAELTGSVIEDIEEDLDDEDESVSVAEPGEVAEADEELLDEAGELLDEDSADDVDEEPVATGDPSSEADETGSADVLEDESQEDLSEEDLSDEEDSDQDLSDDEDLSDEDDSDEDDSDEDDSDEDDSEVAEDTVGGAEDAGKPAEQAGTPGITPAFIEPNFGDVLDVPDETAQKRPKSED
ncbi:hypothetical protein [Nonomuraea terrae]|uniref:hypothetical protein n=1 Tax=Nonomuraea terrae TaxID=2530383 RepID=UPI0014055849|nr:hypothetical protein [Nonomuraea terrae]